MEKKDCIKNEINFPLILSPRGLEKPRFTPCECPSLYPRRHKIEVDLVNYGDDADTGGGNDADDDVDVIYRRCSVLLLLLLQ